MHSLFFQTFLEVGWSLQGSWVVLIHPIVHAQFSASFLRLHCADLQVQEQGFFSQKSAALPVHGLFSNHTLFFSVSLPTILGWLHDHRV